MRHEAAMSDTAATVLVESGFKQAARAAQEFGALSRMLEESGPWLKLATVSPLASDLVSNYRTTLNIAASSGGSKIFLEGYERMRGQLGKLIQSGEVEQSLRDVIELDLRRADAVIQEASTFSKRATTVPKMLPATMTQEAQAVLNEFSQRMKSMGLADDVKAAFAKFLARVKPGDAGWAAMTEMALARAASVKQEFPLITRSTYAQNAAARDLIEVSYTSHGKGEMFEHLARNSDAVTGSIDGELRTAAHRAAQRGVGAKAVLSSGELRLGTAKATGEIGDWKKFADSGVLVTVQRTEATAVAGAAGGAKVDGVAQATALYEFKAERSVSDIPNQQERALPRMIDRWLSGEPVYVALNVPDETGKVSTKIFLLQPPDSKAGLSYFGVGTSNAFIEQRDILARQGATVRNMNLDVSNDEMRGLWYELFWAAFDTL
jgi:hypothetical protein